MGGDGWRWKGVGVRVRGGGGVRERGLEGIGSYQRVSKYDVYPMCLSYALILCVDSIH